MRHIHISHLWYVVHFASDTEFGDHLFSNCVKNTKTILYISPSVFNRTEDSNNRRKYIVLYCISVSVQ